jgi:hypothetical protein
LRHREAVDLAGDADFFAATFDPSDDGDFGPATGGEKLGEARIKKAIPGYYLSTVKGGSSTGILQDICAYTYDIYLVGNAKLPDAVVRSVLQAIWVNIDKLPQFHPGFAEWTKARAVDPEVTIPAGATTGPIRVRMPGVLWTRSTDDFVVT